MIFNGLLQDGRETVMKKRHLLDIPKFNLMNEGDDDLKIQID